MGRLDIDIKVCPQNCSWLQSRVEAFGALTVVSQPYAGVLMLFSSGCSNSYHAAINVSYCIYQNHLLLSQFLTSIYTKY